MFVNVTLCKTPINTTDTLFFANAEAQKAYFNGIQEKHTYAQSSFNGSRSFRIPVNYLEAVNTHYNYMYYTYAGRVWYCFIDNYTYINDTSCEVNVTLDFVQTFIFDITWKSSRIASFTWKQSHFENGYVPYSNKFPSANKKYVKIDDIVSRISNPKEYEDGKIVYLAVTVDVNVQFNPSDKVVSLYIGNDDKNYIEDGKISNEVLAYRGGATLPYYTFLFPLTYKLTTSRTSQGLTYKHITFPDDTDYMASGNNFIDFLQTMQANIIDMSVVPAKITDYHYEDDLLKEDDIDNSGVSRVRIGYNFLGSPVYVHGYMAYAFAHNSLGIPVYTKTVAINGENSLNRSPYKSIVIGNSLSNEEVELNDCILDGSGNVEITVYQEIVPPFISTIVIGNRDNVLSYDKILRFSLDLSRAIPYEVSAWANYLATNSASVNDGLKTKHGYEKEIAKRNMTNTAVQGAVGIGVGILGTIVGGIKGSSQALLGGISQMASGGSQIADSQVQYENTLTNMEKERALLQLSWNDIKSAPSEAVNALNPSVSVTAYDTLYASIYECTAINIDDIKKYHKMYGYQTEEVIEADELKQQHTVFDYIRFEDANFITNLPHNTHQIIKKILESGVRFWYDEENFLNFDIDNQEYQGV